MYKEYKIYVFSCYGYTMNYTRGTSLQQWPNIGMTTQQLWFTHNTEMNHTI